MMTTACFPKSQMPTYFTADHLRKSPSLLNTAREEIQNDFKALFGLTPETD